MDAIVFLVDAFDTQRFPESKNELCSLLADEQLAQCPILILGNKIDRPGAASEDQIRSYFELHATTGKVHTHSLEEGEKNYATSEFGIIFSIHYFSG